MHSYASIESPFSYIPLGGGGGGKKAPVSVRAMDDRATLEQTLGSALLDRLNGYPVKSLASQYRDLGGANETVIKVLERAFGDDFDAVASLGRDEVKKRVSLALTDSLADEGLRFPTTKEFRDVTFHVAADSRDFRAVMRNLAGVNRDPT